VHVLNSAKKHEPHGNHAKASQRRLMLVLGLTLIYTIAEIAGGLAANSLALLADAGHMATDAFALGLAVFAGWISRRPPDRGRTFGYQRAEILASLTNGVILVAICGSIFWEAIHRFASPPAVATGLMAWVASGGLAVNLVSVWLLHGHTEGLNARAAFLHVLGDLLGSVGALVAALLIALFGFRLADPLASVFIGAIIIFSSTRLILRSIHVLMEGTPAHLDPDEIRRALRAIAGVADVHDVHLWSLGGKTPLLSAHLVVDLTVRGHDILRAATTELQLLYGIEHVTLQIEPPDFNIRGIGCPIVDRTSTSP
jgi:cobalt-zinc-cadmium efflux system protein